MFPDRSVCWPNFHRPCYRAIYAPRSLDTMPAVEVMEEADLVDLLGEAA